MRTLANCDWDPLKITKDKEDYRYIVIYREVRKKKAIHTMAGVHDMS